VADHSETPLLRWFFARAHVGITVALPVSGRGLSDVQGVDPARRMAVFVSALVGVPAGSGRGSCAE